MATVHPAWYARAGTWFLNVGHAVKAAIIKVAGVSAGVTTELQKVAPTIESISELVAPGSSTFEQHLLDVWSVAASAVSAAGDAAAANGLSVSLDAATVAAIKALLPAVEKFLHPAASANPPAK